MRRGERDRVDPSLIITEPRISRPTARAQGLNHQEELGAPNNPAGPTTAAAELARNANRGKKREPF
jgi:hypothetical protein